uniref:Major facilitator superfamily (MFS) profile domain-containing protein n=1 Tax=Corethron hystrix TaxID=216773 RepID=A0A7S1FN67_9STRA|mmetsp:Transcript_14556/g.32054  ORF Transcript_14556/g.32054 Transcript_14556/m.32054 type:complete len:697 (+) Transcript_14556:416-2506(+)
MLLLASLVNITQISSSSLNIILELPSLVYIGLMFSCPVSGYLFTAYGNQRIVICGAVLLNPFAVLAMALAPSPVFLYVARFVSGFLRAPIIIYAPVWVDEFAPKKSLTRWVSVLQANVALGIMLGYLLGGIATHYDSPKGWPKGWRLALTIQFFLLCPFVIIFMFVRGKYVNAVGGYEERLKQEMIKQRAKEDQGENISADKSLDAEATVEIPLCVGDCSVKELGKTDDNLIVENQNDKIRSGSFFSESNTLISQLESQTISHLESQTVINLGNDGPVLYTAKEAFSDLLQCRIWLWLTFSLSGLYWVVTGIQFWITKYLLEILNGHPQAVTYGFAITSLTGPVSGVFFGGKVIDALGGYKDDTGEAVVSTLRVCCLFGVGATVFAALSALLMNFWSVLIMIWFVLFFGGALLPAATGISISAVPSDLRAFSNSISMFTYNLLGYAAAPFVMGAISTSIGGKEGLKYGFRFNQAVAGFTLLTFIGAYFAAKSELKNKRAERHAVENQFSVDDEDDMVPPLPNEIEKTIDETILEDNEFISSVSIVGSVCSGGTSRITPSRPPRPPRHSLPPRSLSGCSQKSARNKMLRGKSAVCRVPRRYSSDFIVTMGDISNVVINTNSILNTTHGTSLTREQCESLQAAREQIESEDSASALDVSGSVQHNKESGEHSSQEFSRSSFSSISLRGRLQSAQSEPF